MDAVSIGVEMGINAQWPMGARKRVIKNPGVTLIFSTGKVLLLHKDLLLILFHEKDDANINLYNTSNYTFPAIN